MKEKIYFDLTFSLNPYTGVTKYSTEIISRIIKHHRECHYYGGIAMYHDTLHFWHKLQDMLRLKIRIIPLPASRIFFKIKTAIIPFHIVSGVKADKNIFWANYIPNRPVRGKVITVVHDLNPLYMEEGEILSKYKTWINRTINRSDVIITVSQNSKNEIVQKLNYPSDRIFVVYNGIDFEKFHAKENKRHLERIASKYNLPDSFFLYMGSAYRNKNILKILEAISILPYEISEKYKFVCSNSEEYLRNYACELHIEDKVVFLDKVDEEDKIGVYQLAYFSVYVSLCEGFGIPIIEAQATGTPVITSNISCLPEVAGQDAALFVDPYSVEEIANAMCRLINEEELYQNIIEKGYVNAKKYSWDKSAEQFYEIIRKI